jgi:NAD(P)H-hydrate epimerase
VLSGAVGALLAQGAAPLAALAAGAYLHGKAADTLEKELSRYGVTPSDLPKQMARELKALLS